MFAKRASQFLLNQFNRSSPISRNFFVTPTNVSKIPKLEKSTLSDVIMKKPTKLEDTIQFIYVFVFGAWIGLMDSEERNEFRTAVTTFYQLDEEEGIPNVVENFMKSGISEHKSTPAKWFQKAMVTKRIVICIVYVFCIKWIKYIWRDSRLDICFWPT